MARSTIYGAKKHTERLKHILSKKTENRISKVVYKGADKVRVEARRRIADGAIQGKGHVASQPGEAPNWDTGHLANNISTRKVGPMQAHTASEAEYSDDLENGNSRMEARPFMGPSARAKRTEVVDDVLGEVNKSIRKQ